jgi:hypothetical protein
LLFETRDWGGPLAGAILSAGAAFLSFSAPYSFLVEADEVADERVNLPDPYFFRLIGSSVLPAAVDALLIRFLVDDRSNWISQGKASQAYYANLITDLDPLFMEAYVECARFLSVIRNNSSSAIELIEKGLRVQKDKIPNLESERSLWFWPSKFEIPFAAGYLYLFEKSDLSKAAEVFALASQAPEAPPYVASLGNRLADRKARFEVGLRVLKTIRGWARTKEEEAKFDRRIQNLYLIQFLDQVRSEFESFLVKQPDYRKDFELTPEQMRSYFARFLKEARIGPRDPYGGRVFVDDSGQVTTTTPYESEMGLR